MPALLPVPKVARVVVQGQIQGVNCINVFHCQTNKDFIIQADVTALAAGFRAAYSARFRPLLSTSYTLGTVTVTSLESDIGPKGTAVGSDNGLGGTGTALSAGTALVVSWSIPRNYRGGHPRTYFGGLPSSSVLNPNSWQGAALVSWLAAATGFLADVPAISIPAGTTFVLCTVHRVRNGANLTPPLVDVITSTAVDSRIDSMRRRLGKDR